MNESLGFTLQIAGIVLLLLGVLWFILRAFRRGYWRDFLAPLAAFLRPSKGLKPVLLALLGAMIIAAPIVVNKTLGKKIDDTAKITEGTELTLTGAKVEEFEKLKSMANLTVLQWAHPAVTDAHLAMLADKTELVELDLSDTQITDEGLKTLAKLPKLTSLRLARTKISDEGFRTHLLPLSTLDSLDLTGTAVKASTVREWVNAKPGRKRPST